MVTWYAIGIGILLVLSMIGGGRRMVSAQEGIPSGAHMTRAHGERAFSPGLFGAAFLLFGIAGFLLAMRLGLFGLHF